MLIERDGEVLDLDPRVVSCEERIVRALRRYGPTRQRDLWFRTGSVRVGRDAFVSALESLVRRDVIRRLPTNRVNAFIYRMSPDKRRGERAAKRLESATQE